MRRFSNIADYDFSVEQQQPESLRHIADVCFNIEIMNTESLQTIADLYFNVETQSPHYVASSQLC